MMGIQDAATTLNQTQTDLSIDVTMLRTSAQTATGEVLSTDTTVNYDPRTWTTYLSATTSTTTDGTMVDCSRDPTNSFCTASSTTGTIGTIDPTTNTTTNTTTDTTGSGGTLSQTVSCVQSATTVTIDCTGGTLADFCKLYPGDSLCTLTVAPSVILATDSTLNSGSTLLYQKYSYPILTAY